MKTLGTGGHNDTEVRALDLMFPAENGHDTYLRCPVDPYWYKFLPQKSFLGSTISRPFFWGKPLVFHIYVGLSQGMPPQTTKLAQISIVIFQLDPPRAAAVKAYFISSENQPGTLGKHGKTILSGSFNDTSINTMGSYFSIFFSTWGKKTRWNPRTRMPTPRITNPRIIVVGEEKGSVKCGV